MFFIRNLLLQNKQNSFDFIRSSVPGLIAYIILPLNRKLREKETNWSFVKDLCIHSAMTLTEKICSNRADLLKSACRNPPQFGDFFSNLPLCRFTEICMQKSPPPGWRCFLKSATLQIYWNLHAEIPPQVWRFFSNLPLCRFTEICMQKFPPWVWRFFSNLPLCRFTEICMQKFPPLGWRCFLKSATLQIYWNLHAEIPPQVGDVFPNLPLCRFTEICM